MSPPGRWYLRRVSKSLIKNSIIYYTCRGSPPPSMPRKHAVAVLVVSISIVALSLERENEQHLHQHSYSRRNIGVAVQVCCKTTRTLQSSENTPSEPGVGVIIKINRQPQATSAFLHLYVQYLYRQKLNFIIFNDFLKETEHIRK